MDLTDALARRTSIRAFLDRPLPPGLLREALAEAGRAPSNGNLQPWRLYAVSGASLARLRERVRERLARSPDPDPVEYAVYPSPLKEPYKRLRDEVGAQLYEILGIAREDRAGRRRQFARNAEFFGAPAALFCYIDRSLGPGQWLDAGMYLQSLMLLLQARGVSSCAQGYWTFYHQVVAETLQVPPDWMLACGLAVGYADPDAPINALRASRLPLADYATFLD